MEFEKRTDLQYDAIEQLKTVIRDNLSNHNKNGDIDASLIYDNLVESEFISITPPLEVKEPPMMQLLTMDSLRNYKDGSSIKPGNILLNIRKLIEAIPDVVLTGTGMVYDNPVIIICCALRLWNKLIDIATINISKEQASVIVALWKNCKSNHEISLNDGYVVTNNLFKQYDEAEITSLKYNRIIDSLVKIECIELTEEIIWLRERISKNYIHDI